jgi:hypothetical protein
MSKVPAVPWVLRETAEVGTGAALFSDPGDNLSDSLLARGGFELPCADASSMTTEKSKSVAFLPALNAALANEVNAAR